MLGLSALPLLQRDKSSVSILPRLMPASSSSSSIPAAVLLLLLLNFAIHCKKQKRGEKKAYSVNRELVEAGSRRRMYRPIAPPASAATACPESRRRRRRRAFATSSTFSSCRRHLRDRRRRRSRRRRWMICMFGECRSLPPSYISVHTLSEMSIRRRSFKSVGCGGREKRTMQHFASVFCVRHT